MRKQIRALWPLLPMVVLVLAAASCGAGQAPEATGEPPAEAAGTSGGEEQAAAPAAAELDTARFSTVLPEDWEIMSDALEKMGMMTLAKKGTGGSTGVYLKFEGNGNWDGDPLAEMESFSARQDGTPAEMVTINGIDWAMTSYEAYGTEQTMYVTKHNGNKVTATVMGDPSSPGVEAIMGSFTLK